MLRRSLDHGTGVRGRYMGIEEGTGKQIGGRRNENATMNVRSYEVGHDKQLKNTRNIESGEIESGGNRKASKGKEVEEVWACDDKRGALGRKEGDGNESTREREERKT